MKTYDVIVIGSGGGSKITRPAANEGFKVAIFEPYKLGGTCLNHGCIPSKMLIHIADLISSQESMKKFEILPQEQAKIQFDKLIHRVSSTIDSESDSIQPLYNDHPNIDLYQEHARFKENHVIITKKGVIYGKKIVITAGCRASIPRITGLKETPYWTYKEALRPKKLPESLVIIGGGYIASELGYFYAKMGTRVTFLVREVMLRELDEDIKKTFLTMFSKKFNVKIGYLPYNISYQDNTFTIMAQCEGRNHQFQSEELLIATGFQPNTDTLNLNNTGIQTDSKGFITVDTSLQTSIPNIYAYGDIIGRYQFRHTANYEGEYLLNRHILNTHNKSLEYPPIPYAVFTSPQIAGVGETEKTLQKKSIAYLVGKNNYRDSAMGMALLSSEEFVKLLFHKQENYKLVGAHIIGKEAATMAHMLIAFIKMKATLDDLLDTIYIHPALPEVIRNAARNANKLRKT